MSKAYSNIYEDSVAPSGSNIYEDSVAPSGSNINEERNYKIIKKLIRPIQIKLLIYIIVFVLVLLTFVGFFAYMNFHRGKKLFLNPFYYKRPIPAGMSDGLPKSSSNNLGSNSLRTNIRNTNQ